MTRVPTGRPSPRTLLARTPGPVIDIALVLICLLDMWVGYDPEFDGLSVVLGVIATAALLIRRRWPYAAFVLGVPSMVAGGLTLAPLAALYTVAARSRRQRLVFACAVVALVCLGVLNWPWQPIELDAVFFQNLGYVAAYVAAAIFLGRLVQTRQDLSARLVEIEEAREHERDLVAQTVLAKERAQLAREMHDVVSNQVGLIAIQAGALQVSSNDPATIDAADTIRQVSVRTLDELRHMVAVLRASGSPLTDLAPQPTLAELGPLVANSGIVTKLVGDLPDTVVPQLQRAIYRTVQEALANARKHSPGSSATVEVWHDQTHAGVTIVNTAPTRAVHPLPSAKHGLVGLRERADLLGGVVDTGATEDGGFRVRLRVPLEQPLPYSAAGV